MKETRKNKVEPLRIKSPRLESASQSCQCKNSHRVEIARSFSRITMPVRGHDRVGREASMSGQLDRAKGICGVKISRNLNTFWHVKCNVIGTAKERIPCFYCTWVILNKWGRKRNGEGVIQGRCENARIAGQATVLQFAFNQFNKPNIYWWGKIWYF